MADRIMRIIESVIQEIARCGRGRTSSSTSSMTFLLERASGSCRAQTGRAHGRSDYAYNRERDTGDSTLWPRQDFIINFVYDLPFGKGKRFLSGANGPGTWQIGLCV